MTIINTIQEFIMQRSEKMLFALLIFIIGYYAIWLIRLSIKKFFNKTPFNETMEIFVRRIISFFLYCLLAIYVLQYLGFSMGPWITGLGIAGIIVGFATKDIFSNFAAGLLLIMNRPFDVKDDVEIAKVTGTVKEINIAACVLTTKKYEYITIPNAKIWNGPIINFSRLKKGKK